MTIIKLEIKKTPGSGII